MTCQSGFRPHHIPTVPVVGLYCRVHHVPYMVLPSTLQQGQTSAAVAPRADLSLRGPVKAMENRRPTPEDIRARRWGQILAIRRAQRLRAPGRAPRARRGLSVAAQLLVALCGCPSRAGGGLPTPDTGAPAGRVLGYRPNCRRPAGLLRGGPAGTALRWRRRA